MTLVAAGAVALGDEVVRPGWVQTRGDRIVDCGAGTPPGSVDVEARDSTVVPGFVDMHVHGGGGASMTDGDVTDIRRAVAFHRAHGTTTTMASLVSAHPDALLAAVTPLSELTRAGEIAGIHLEGPWISGARCGAHDPTALRDPDRAEIDRVLRASDGTVRMVTLAPELPGAPMAIRRLVESGVVVAVGHTDCTYQQAREAIAAGARVATHLFNAMRGLHHREPGPVLALLEDDRVTVELIADGVHADPALIRYVIDTAGSDRVALVTDAMAAAGAADGAFRLGSLDVDVDGGVARLHGSDTIAGSTATMDQLFRAALNGRTTDAAVTAAVTMTSTTPAAAMGLEGIGRIQPGYRADLVLLDARYQVARVMAGGTWQSADVGPVSPTDRD